METMFCYQCEQTVKGTGCTGRMGACGKEMQTSALQDQLTGALIGLARATAGKVPEQATTDLVLAGLFTTITNVSFNNDTLRPLIQRVRDEAARYGGGQDYDMDLLWTAPDEDLRSLKSLILFGLRGVAAYAYHAMVQGYRDPRVDAFFYEALRQIADEGDKDKLLKGVLKVGEINLLCMALLDRANTSSYGDPVPTQVPLLVEKGPFIVISGHDLKDLQLLLEQTAGRGVNVYTHGEMLPAHGYPKLKAHPHLKGNFGTAWQNQQKEFKDLPAPVLFTTNCIMPVKANYADRIFTTEVVSYPGMTHIGPDKDFGPLIDKALALGGYREDRRFTGINGGETVMTGFAHTTVMGVAGTIVDAVRSGALNHIFLVGGCDGAKPGRNYYTDIVKGTPKDSIVLTLACGKFRFNDLDLGTLGGLPRILDMGQCNDAYSAIQVAVALAEAFHCSVNELPLHIVLSWYEQKAVCVLLTLLHLGIRNIRLGPTLPAFVSPAVLELLVKTFNIAPTTTARADLAAMLGLE
ncbi:MAG: hydroxylamine reductase [Christensenellales bacterium]